MIKCVTYKLLIYYIDYIYIVHAQPRGSEYSTCAIHRFAYNKFMFFIVHVR